MIFDSPIKAGQENTRGEPDQLKAAGDIFTAELLNNNPVGSTPKLTIDVQFKPGSPSSPGTRPSADDVPVIVGPTGHGHGIQGPDFVGTDPGNFYVARGTPGAGIAVISAHAGASVYAGENTRTTADGGSIYATGNAIVTAVGNTKIFYRGEPRITASENTEVYQCTGGDEHFVGASCHRVR